MSFMMMWTRNGYILVKTVRVIYREIPEDVRRLIKKDA